MYVRIDTVSSSDNCRAEGLTKYPFDGSVGNDGADGRYFTAGSLLRIRSVPIVIGKERRG